MEPFRSSINIMSGYQPGEQPPPDVKVIKLNTNENPYPPSPRVLKVLRELDVELLRRYPDPMAQDFRQAASAVLGVPPDWILVGNGNEAVPASNPVGESFIPRQHTLCIAFWCRYRRQNLCLTPLEISTSA